MTVGELIKKLSTLPTDHRVVVDGYEGGYEDLTSTHVVVDRIVVDVDSRHWMGDHLSLSEWTCDKNDPDCPKEVKTDDVKVEEAVVLSRCTNVLTPYPMEEPARTEEPVVREL